MSNPFPVKGVLITLEGIDGSGKSSAAKFLAKRLPILLPTRGLVFTAEPTNGEAGRILRSRLTQSYGKGDVASARKMEELFLFLADHAWHLAEKVIPSLERGDIVISDRYADSTAAYQGVTLQEILPDPLMWIRELSRPWNVLPDLTILFHLEPEKAVERLSARPGKERFERLDFLREVDLNFHRLQALEPERFALLNAEEPLEQVAQEAISLIMDCVERTA